MRLNEVKTGQTVEFVMADASQAMQNRLAGMGLRAGISLRIIQRNAHAGMLVAIGNTRLALNTQLCASIMVREMTQTPCGLLTTLADAEACENCDLNHTDSTFPDPVNNQIRNGETI